MYVLCTLVVLTLHSLIKGYYKALEAKASPDAEPGRRGRDPADGAPPGGLSGDGSGQRRVSNRLELAHCRLESQPGRAGRLHYVPNRRKHLKVRRGQSNGGDDQRVMPMDVCQEKPYDLETAELWW